MTESHDDGALIGTWQLESIGGTAVSDDVSTTIRFFPDGNVSGHGGVNGYGGTYRVTGSTIELGPLRSTMMAGPEPAMAQETQVFQALEETLAFSVVGDALLLGELQWRRAVD
jgi:putative lipoprotein